MDETWVYLFYRNILTSSSAMQGRFVLLDGSVGDINAANFGKVVTDALNGLTVARKYPAVVMLPPVEIDVEPLKGWVIMKNDLLFLTLDGRNGDGTMKLPNSFLQVSQQTPAMDWAEMKIAASNFIAQINKTLVANKTILANFRLRSQQQIVYRRISLETSERLNGIRVSFDTMIFKPCLLTDYAEDAEIAIPEWT